MSHPLGRNTQEDSFDLILVRLGFCLHPIAALLLGVVILSSKIAMPAARWAPTGGPEGGLIRPLAIDPQNPRTIYAGAVSGGVFKSVDGGRTWNAATRGMANQTVMALAIDSKDPRTVYAGTEFSGVFKTRDGGDTWSAVNSGLPSQVVNGITIDPYNSSNVYACTTWTGLFKSGDGGSSWSQVPGIGNKIVQALAFDPKDPKTLYLVSDSWGTNGVFKSVDGGVNWFVTSLVLDNGFSSLAVDPINPMNVYAGTYYQGVFKSADGGTTWTPVNTGLTTLSISSLAVDPLNPATVYAGSLYGGGVFKSTDGGASWKPANSGISPANLGVWVAVDPQNPANVYAGTAGGVIKSSNGADSWSLMRLSANRILALAIDPQSPATLYAGTDLDGTVFKTTNGGSSWSGGPQPDVTSAITTLAVDTLSPTTLYAGLESGGVLKSTDGGASWNQVNAGLTNPYVHALAIDPRTPSTIYVGTEHDAFKSTDGGASWTKITEGLYTEDIGGLIVLALAIDPVNPAIVYAICNVGLYKTADGGQSWKILPRADIIESLAVDPRFPTNVYAGTRSSGVYKSTDRGETWTAANAGNENTGVSALAVDPENSSIVYAGIYQQDVFRSGEGVLRSTDGGASWSQINEGLTNTDVRALAIDPQDPTKVYAGTYGGGVFVLSGLTQAPLALTAGGTASTSTHGRGHSQVSGYSTLTVDTGSAPYATAVISYRQNGAVVSEVGVPASPPTTSARIFLDYRSAVPALPGCIEAGTVDINTGIAVVNLGSGTANVTYLLRNVLGATLSNGHGNIVAGAHFAKFIDQMKDVASDFSLPLDFESTVQFGSLEISSDQPLSILALRMTTNQRNEVLFTTTPTADLTQSLTSTPMYFPQFADGAGFTTALVLLNTSDGIETGTFQILDDMGAPLVVNQVGGTADSSFKYSIASGGALRFQTDGFPATTKVGWVQLTPDAGTSTPVAAGMFGYNPENVLVMESGIAAAAATTHARVYVDLSGGHNTGLAVANLAAANANIFIRAFQSDGTTAIRTSQGPLRLPAKGHSAKFADEFVVGLPAEFTGVLDIRSAMPFAALTMRSLKNERGDFLLTTLPIADVNRAAPSPILFPQIADGGGYVTQFILLSPGGAASTTLNFYGETGAPLAVGKW